MSRRNSVAASVGIGMAIGAAIGYAGSTMMGSNTKTVKRTVGKAIRAVGDLVDNFQYMTR